MKTKYILLSCLWSLFFLCSCSDENGIAPENLKIGFIKAGMDVGENAGIVRIPINIEGASEQQPIDISIEIHDQEGSAKRNVDYKFENQILHISRAGECFIEVEIIDNTIIETNNRTFTLVIHQATEGVVHKITTLEINIINDDTPAITIPGNYTLMASDFVKGGTPWSSSKGKVVIEADSDTPGKYWMRNLELNSEEGILLLTLEEGIYFTINEQGEASIPTMQNVGDYGDGEALLVGIKGEEGIIIEDNIPLKIDSSGIHWDIDGIAAIVPTTSGISAIYYALRNVILKKTK